MQSLQRALQQSSPEESNPFYRGDWLGLVLEIGTLFLLFSTMLALRNNMGDNEIDVLPLARQYAQSGWIPNDWYLNQPPGYRLLFQTIFGSLAAAVGFLATSIGGRLFCYLLLSSGIVLIARKLSLKLPFLILAVALNLSLHVYRGATPFSKVYYAGLAEEWLGKQSADALFYGIILLALGLLAISKKVGIDSSFAWLLLAGGLFLAADNHPQSIAAGEWYVGGLEAKAVAYALAFLAIALMLHSRYLWMALLFGLATSFHVLAGGYPMMAAISYLLLRRRSQLTGRNHIGLIVLIYLLGAAFAIPAVVTQLISSGPLGSLTPSFIYVFVRLPHHLNPAVWPTKWWISLIFYLSILVISLHLIKKKTRLSSPSPGDASSVLACFELFEFTLIALIPFGLGLLISPFDPQGTYLQYYPFRFGDMFLPFSTCLLFACALQYRCAQYSFLKRSSTLTLTVLIGLFLTLKTVEFKQEISALSNFPSLQPAQAELYRWTSSHTEPSAKFVVPPSSGMATFTWMTERPALVSWKLLPQTKAGIIEWYTRLSDVTGDPNLSSAIALNENTPVFTQVENILIDKYQNLKVSQIKALLKKYQARYFLTSSDTSLALPVVFRNSSYTLYRSAD